MGKVQYPGPHFFPSFELTAFAFTRRVSGALTLHHQYVGLVLTDILP